MKRWRWFAALAPLALGGVVKVLVAVEWITGLVFYLRADLGNLTLLVGLAVSALALASLLLSWQVQESCRRETVQIREQLAEDRRRFLRRLDHELKNPLTAIQAGLANVADVPSERVRRQALDSIKAQAVRLSRLAADLRKLAELETRSLERTAVNVADLLQEVVEVAGERPEAAERQLRLTVPQAPWPLPEVDGDPDLLFLAVHNLLNNALKFTASGDRVEIRAFEDGTAVVVEVADTGPGIPEEEVAHVWEELYRGQGARGIPGSGLGLALVRAIVERHGGGVGLRSRVGQGSVFSISLPLGHPG